MAGYRTRTALLFQVEVSLRGQGGVGGGFLSLWSCDWTRLGDVGHQYGVEPSEGCRLRVLGRYISFFSLFLDLKPCHDTRKREFRLGSEWLSLRVSLEDLKVPWVGAVNCGEVKETRQKGNNGGRQIVQIGSGLVECV